MTELTQAGAAPANESQSNRAEELQKAMAEVLPMFDMPQEEASAAFADFVRRRVEVLSMRDSGKPIGVSEGGTATFIAPTTEMRGNFLITRPYFLDDPSAYEVVFSDMKKAYVDLRNMGKSEEQAYLNAAVSAAGYVSAKYFGTIAGDEATRNAILDDDMEGPRSRSIADFRGKPAAMCQERAGLMHNTLKVLGVEGSRLEAGKLAEVTDEGRHEVPHAFIVYTTSKGEKYIFDPTNPTLLFNEAGDLVAFNPARYKIEDEHAASQTVTLLEYQQTGEEQPAAIRTRTLEYHFEQRRS